MADAWAIDGGATDTRGMGVTDVTKKPKKPKKDKEAQDATIRNVRAARARFDACDARINDLTTHVLSIGAAVITLQKQVKDLLEFPKNPPVGI